MFENKIFEGIYYSRFLASWTNVAGVIDYHFKDWLKTVTVNGKPIPDNIIEEIYELGTNGKLELELSAEEFIRNLEF